MVGAGLEDGLLLARQDVLRGVRCVAPTGEGDDEHSVAGFVDEADIPTAGAVHALAAAEQVQLRRQLCKRLQGVTDAAAICTEGGSVFDAPRCAVQG